MSSDWVLDASVAFKLFSPEPDSDEVREMLGGLHADSAFIVPLLIRQELGHACKKAGRLDDFETRFDDFVNGTSILEPEDIAAHCDQLSYYDATYLALAYEQKAGLLTVDDKLRKAAKKLGVPVKP